MTRLRLGRALYVADAARGCMWAMSLDDDGLPDSEHPRIVVRGAGTPVDLQVDGEGRLYYLDFAAGAIVRLEPSA